MIIISAALPKSASTLVCNYQEDMLGLLKTGSGQAELRKAFNGRFVSSLNFIVALRLLYLHHRYGTFVIKTHARPGWLVRRLVKSGIAKVTYCFRDPRDVVLSAIDHGRKSREGLDPAMSFIEFSDVPRSIPRVKRMLKVWRAWKALAGAEGAGRAGGSVHFIRYESLMEKKLEVLEKMAEFLGLDIPAGELKGIVEKHEALKETAWNFNVGTVGRYKAEMTPSEIEACNNAFCGFLKELEYEM